MMEGRRLKSVSAVPALLLAGFCFPLHAAEAPPFPEGASLGRRAVEWTLSLDPFTLTAAFLFAAALVGVIVKGRLRDRCLKAFHGCPVTVSLDGSLAKGRFILGNAAFELLFPEPETAGASRRTSCIVYQSEYGRIRYIMLDPDELDSKSAAGRNRRIRRVLRPGPLGRFGRWLSNLAGSFKDAFNDFLGLLIGRFRPGTLKRLAKGREKYAGRIETDIVSLVPNSSYDAILEDLRGHRVELEVREEGIPPVVSGILEEYTSSYIALTDVVFPSGPAPEGAFVVREESGRTVLENRSGRPLFLSGEERAFLPPGEKVEIPSPETGVVLSTVTADVIFPRSAAVVRYRLE